jgi:hypothetical protein
MKMNGMIKGVGKFEIGQNFKINFGIILFLMHRLP